LRLGWSRPIVCWKWPALRRVNERIRRTRYQRRRRRGRSRHARHRSLDREAPFRTDSDLSRRCRRWHAGFADSLRLARMIITWLIFIPLAGAVGLYVGRPISARLIALIFQTVALFYVLMIWQSFDPHT